MLKYDRLHCNLQQNSRPAIILTMNMSMKVLDVGEEGSEDSPSSK